MKSFFTLLSFSALATLGLQAGDWGKAPIDKTPIEECVDLGGEISVGYETHYIFNGIVFAGDSRLDRCELHL